MVIPAIGVSVPVLATPSVSDSSQTRSPNWTSGAWKPKSSVKSSVVPIGTTVPLGLWLWLSPGVPLKTLGTEAAGVSVVTV